MCSRFLSVVAIALTAGAVGCDRERREYRPSASETAAPSGLMVGELHAGVSLPPSANRYEKSAYAVLEGRRLYSWFNCEGCHFLGGGGIGPALMDDEWIYGSHPANVFATIVEGRPNGMPSFRNKIPEYQVWQLVAYVRSMSGQVAKDVAPGRPDHMSSRPVEQAVPWPPGRTGGQP